HDLAGAAMGSKDAVLRIVVHRVARAPPVVDAEKEDPVAVEAVDGESLNQRPADPLALVGEAIGARGAGLGDGDALSLTAGVVEDHRVGVVGERNQGDVVLRKVFGDKTVVARSQGPVGEMPSVAVCSANTTPPAPESRAVSCNDVAVHAAGTVKPR